MKKTTRTIILCLSIASLTVPSFAYQTSKKPTYRSNYYHNTNAYTSQRTNTKSTYQPNYYRHTNKASTQQPSEKFVSGCRLGFDVMGGTISNPTTIKYGITDLYTNQKTSEYSFDSTLAGAGFNIGLQHYQKFESELFVDLYGGGTKSAPAYYNYISYPMRVSGFLVSFGLREHYYYPLSEKFKLDLALGLGGISSSGKYTDKYDIEAYRQEPWSDTVFMYDGTIGFVYYPWDFLPLRFGYTRASFSSDYIGKGLNKFYFGVSYLFD